MAEEAPRHSGEVRRQGRGRNREDDERRQEHERLSHNGESRRHRVQQKRARLRSGQKGQAEHRRSDDDGKRSASPLATPEPRSKPLSQCLNR